MSTLAVIRKILTKARAGKRRLPDEFTTALGSEAIAAVSYDGDDDILTITFTSGSVYELYDIPKIIAVGLVEAGSAGRYFQDNIREDYEYSRAS